MKQRAMSPAHKWSLINVRYAPVATKFHTAAKWRDVPRATSIALLDLNEPTRCTGPDVSKIFELRTRRAAQESCSNVSATWLFPNENVGLNLPFAVGLMFIKLDGASGQHGRFVAFYQ
jgi:hypothetical protein